MAGRPEDSKSRRANPLPKKDRLTPDIYRIVRTFESAIAHETEEGRRPFAAKCGVYGFYDYDGEPIYVGQTYETLRTRVRRHLTNQRTDAVAMHVLDPMEVAEVEVWPFWEFEDVRQDDKPRWREMRDTLRRAEYTVFRQLLDESALGRLLNEKSPAVERNIRLPDSYRFSIVPDDIRQRLNHPDERIARRASTIANLAQVVRERDVNLGLRQTLMTQADRLHRLSTKRYEQVKGEVSPSRLASELEREGPEDESDGD